MNPQRELLYKDITDKILKSAFEVYNDLGYGFLEKVYENALLLALRENGALAEQQKTVPVYFKEKIIGEYFADILVENKIVIEIKTAESFSKAHFAQVLNYLKATKLRLGFLINFGPNGLEYKRIIR
ncbi:MAG TPA: GxxExxY protein [Anaerohalosphaeraceae bacterium]|nr:GxxExxY protein [Anaerohalosphaeraceae bacterium]